MRKRLANTPVVRFLTSLKFPVVCLALLMVIIFWGTLYQKEFGLYEAQQRFFYSWWIWVFGVIPIPGARLVLWVFFTALLTTMVFKLEYSRRTVGIVIIHTGVLSFFLTAFLSFHFSRHSALQLAEGGSVNVSADYHRWELSVWTAERDTPQRVVRDVRAIDAEDFRLGRTISIPGLDLKIDVLDYFTHCMPTRSSRNAYGAQSVSGIGDLQEARRPTDPEDYRPGGFFRVTASDGHQHAYLLYASDPRPAVISHREDVVHLALRRVRYPLPFAVHLIDFERRVHPGTQIASSFSSRVEIGEGASSRRVLISMNEPLRHIAFTFFQASFLPDERSSVLAVVENPTRWMPYISSTITFAGLLLHFLIMLGKSIRTRSPGRRAVEAAVGVAVLLGAWDVRAAGADDLSLSELKRVTIQYGGRAMPLDSYARAKLLEFSGRQKYGEHSAMQWLARILFEPETTFDDKIFLINNPEIADTLGVSREKRRRYAYRSLEAGFGTAKNIDFVQRVIAMEDKQRTPYEKEFLRAYVNTLEYAKLTTTFTFDDPHQDFRVSAGHAQRLGLGDEARNLSCLNLLAVMDVLRNAFLTSHAKPANEMTDFDETVLRIVSALFSRKQTMDRISVPFSVMPDPSADPGIWSAPWKMAVNLAREPYVAAELSALSRVKQAYLLNDRLILDRAVIDFRSSVRNRAAAAGESRMAELELMYNRLRPFFIASLLYAFGFLFGLCAFIFWERPMLRVSLVLNGVGWLFHTAGIVARMLIMGRPPMTNLYATFLFVAWIIVVLGFVLVRFGKGPVGSVLAGFAGLALLMVASRFATDGDTMGVLVAVLDSNFWLSTHVVAINMGYAGCVAAGVVGHIYLLLAVLRARDRRLLADTYRAMLGVLGFGLIFSTLGTMLGGIWADQSWGRFWGWDPKENGALLIVMWCALLFHARLSGMIRHIGMAVGTVIGVSIVMLAWFGVNILSVGLHSYGFTSGAQTGLLAFFAVELIFLLITAPLAGRKASTASTAPCGP